MRGEREHPFIRGHWSEQPFWDRNLGKLNSACFVPELNMVERESIIMNLSHRQEIPAHTTGPLTWLMVFLSSSNLQFTLLHVHTQMIAFISSSQGQQKPLEKYLLMTPKLDFRLLSQPPICLFSCLFSTLIWISNKFSKLLLTKAKSLLIFFPCSCCQQVVMPSIYMFKATYSNPLLPIYEEFTLL